MENDGGTGQIFITARLHMLICCNSRD